MSPEDTAKIELENSQDTIALVFMSGYSTVIYPNGRVQNFKNYNET